MQQQADIYLLQSHSVEPNLMENALQKNNKK
jgi:hypothetical protein